MSKHQKSSMASRFPAGGPNAAKPPHKKLEPQYLFAALVASFCAAGIFSLLFTKTAFINITFVTEASPFVFLIVLLLVFAFLLFAAVWFSSDRVIPAALLLLSTLFCIQLVCEYSANMYFNLGLVLILGVIAYWVSKGDKLSVSSLKITDFHCRVILIACFAVMAFTIGYFTVLRQKVFYTANFDFGIFAQMFEYMKHTGLPNTTTERNYLLSHFGVHFSPIYYLLLPGYMIFSVPEYLLVVQALAVAAGVFAVYGICRRLELSPMVTAVFLLLYTFFPSLTNGCFFDFHENKFLTILILWAVYFMLGRKSWPFYLFCFLILMVKEDAAIYVATLGLFLLINRRDYKRGFTVLGMSIVYFLAAISIVGMLGDGVMVSRLENYFLPGTEGAGGFLSVIRTCFFNIGYLIQQVFTEEKFPFLLWMLVPVMFTPLLNKKVSTLVLLIPMLVINLMSNYQYQYHIGYQYTFGVAALVLTAAILTIRQMTPEKRRFVLTASLVSCLVLTFSLNYPKIQNVTSNYKSNQKVFQATEECLDRIPDDAEITATTFLIPHLTNHKTVYMFPNYYNESEYTDYLVIKGTEKDSEEGLSEFMADRYELVDQGGLAEVYKLK